MFKSNCLTQKELNKLAEGPDFVVGVRYINTLKTLFLASFFGPFLPICYVIGLFTVLLQYLIIKYNFLRLFKEPPVYDERPAKKAVSLLQFVIVCHILIVLIFFYKLETTKPFTGIPSSNYISYSLVFAGNFPLSNSGIRDFYTTIYNKTQLLVFYIPLFLMTIALFIYFIYKILQYTLFVCCQELTFKRRISALPLYTEIRYIENYACPVDISSDRHSLVSESISNYLKNPNHNLFNDESIYKSGEVGVTIATKDEEELADDSKHHQL